jgi:hypothetical protein
MDLSPISTNQVKYIGLQSVGLDLGSKILMNGAFLNRNSTRVEKTWVVTQSLFNPVVIFVL